MGGCRAVKRGPEWSGEVLGMKVSRLYLPFPARFLATLIICKSRESHAAARDETRARKYQLPATKLKAIIRISDTDSN